jgi:hypothetical protein
MKNCHVGNKAINYLLFLYFVSPSLVQPVTSAFYTPAFIQIGLPEVSLAFGMMHELVEREGVRRKLKIMHRRTTQTVGNPPKEGVGGRNAGTALDSWLMWSDLLI